ncbi:hypothetical protein HPB47_011564 [Ixodes persulcatus]|uniref:Uncharacterized protein n=1 Tax=Ixodes persulcatus TaxID=34615 RepID=A0AC60NW17_IXOPE|nr:hypothetical protein HPB47_011564 [Ixodes persulcatus]
MFADATRGPKQIGASRYLSSFALGATANPKPQTEFGFSACGLEHLEAGASKKGDGQGVIYPLPLPNCMARGGEGHKEQKGLKDASGNKVSPLKPTSRWAAALAAVRSTHATTATIETDEISRQIKGDYIPNVASNRRYLRQEAVPSIFAFNVAKRPPRKKPQVREAPPSTRKFSVADAGVTNDAIADPSSQVATSEPASEEASYAFADLTGGHAAPGASSQKEASGEIVTVNAMEDFTADFTCHAVATEDSVVNDYNIDDCVNAATGAVCITWINYIFVHLGQLDLWLPRAEVNDAMPPAFKERYTSTRVILDATEVRCEASSSLVLQLTTFSTYKSTNTFKGLLGISPDGAVTFVSQLFTGSISDKDVVEKSGFLKLPFDDGDSVMADKGFKIQGLLSRISVKLNIPPFLRRGISQRKRCKRQKRSLLSYPFGAAHPANQEFQYF